MNKNERRVFLLDFEKPLWELEARIEQIRKLAKEVASSWVDERESLNFPLINN